ncbi:hypothetical protein T4A_1274, partial [Trichinella pseudospiralis]
MAVERRKEKKSDALKTKRVDFNGTLVYLEKTALVPNTVFNLLSNANISPEWFSRSQQKVKKSFVKKSWKVAAEKPALCQQLCGKFSISNRQKETEKLSLELQGKADQWRIDF